MDPTAKPAPAAQPTVVIAEVKYSLPAMLRELAADRATATFAMEKMDQVEIGKLFKAKPRHRAKLQK